MTTRLALATCAAHPDIDEDAPLLAGALRRLGIEAEPAVWTDDSVRWDGFDAVVVRGTWDYPQQRDRFLEWAHAVERVTLLANPAEVLRWTTDKTYLRELAAAGLPVVETAWLEPGQGPGPVDDLVLSQRGEYVVKPAVSAGSKDTGRYVAGKHDDRARAHARDLLGRGRTVMVQPYLVDVDTHGETALLYVGGRFSHAVRKGPLLTAGMALVEGTYAPETIDSRTPSAAELAVADAVLDAVPWARETLSYARVDLVPGPDARPTLLELELAEPSMFLEHAPQAAAGFAAAIADLVGDDGGRAALTPGG